MLGVLLVIHATHSFHVSSALKLTKLLCQKGGEKNKKEKVTDKIDLQIKLSIQTSSLAMWSHSLGKRKQKKKTSC